MSTLLEMYGEDAGLTEGLPKKLRRVSLGLQVTTSSLCDVSVHVDTGNGEGHLYQVELAVGELKHRDTNTTAQCIAQALLYVQTIFFWLRVELGLPVRTVYGFATLLQNLEIRALSLLARLIVVRLKAEDDFFV